MKTGKTGKYFKYAIGEIILVVIGILIALSINNWNKIRLQDIKNDSILTSLLNDFKTNDSLLSERLTYTKGLVFRLERFLEISNKPELKTERDSIKYYAAAGFRGNGFLPVLDTYNQAVNTGDLGLITNKKLIKKFNEFKEKLNFNNTHMKISGEVFYQGSIFEIRKEIGNIDNLQPPVLFAKRKTFDAHLLSDDDLRAYISKPQVFATFDSHFTIQNNFKEVTEEMIVITKKLIRLLETELYD
jgi:hypothetical protein